MSIRKRNQWSSQSYKKFAFDLLYAECRRSGPSVHFPFKIEKIFEQLWSRERREVVSWIRGGCSPLFVCCKTGKLDIVEFLIESCGADVDQKCMFEETADIGLNFVTPLWCASVAGNLGVVKYLVEEGANVNSTSTTGSTPVLAACLKTNYKIVVFLVSHNADILKPDYNGSTCLINSVKNVELCQYLISLGARVNDQDVHFKTALHYAIETHNFETTKLLLKNGADPFIKSRYGDDALQTACLKAATNVFDYLVKQYDYSNVRIAEAHELIGSTFQYNNDSGKALDHWKTAIAIRYNSTYERIEKKCADRKAPYLYATEFKTLEELDNIDADAMYIQSMIVCERILGAQHHDIFARLIRCGAIHAHKWQFLRSIDLWQYILELLLKQYCLLNNDVCFAVQALACVFLGCLKKQNEGKIHEKIQVADVVASIRLLMIRFQEAQELLTIRPLSLQHQKNFDIILKVITHFFYFIYVTPKTSEEVVQMKTLVKDVISTNPRSSTGDTMLHLVVSKLNYVQLRGVTKYPRMIFPDANVAELLLSCGSYIEAMNDNRSTPLHIAVFLPNYHSAVIEVLLRYGAHIDRRNGNGNYPHCMLRSRSECTINHFQYITLKCLAARKVIEKKIIYQGNIPVALEEFVRMH